MDLLSDDKINLEQTLWGLSGSNENFGTFKKGGCYIATSVYDSYNCPEVQILRRFRDNNIAKTWYGRQLIRIYYMVSPKIVCVFRDSLWFKSVSKTLIDKILIKLQNNYTNNETD